MQRAYAYTCYHKLLNLYTKSGHGLYTIGEPLTILQHSIECAKYQLETQQPELIAAALLHDIGHILKTPIDPNLGIDDKHEIIGANFLSAMGFSENITKPIKMHVDAKRYLCYKNPLYEMSSGSKISLNLQGGPMSKYEALEFEKTKFFKEAIKLRIADDNAKKNTCFMKFSDFQPYILNSIKSC